MEVMLNTRVLTIWCSNSLKVHLHLVYNVAPQSHIEERRARNLKQAELTSRLPTSVLTQAQWRQEHIFSCQCVNSSLSRGKRSSFEIKTILSHFSGFLKVFWRLSFPFPFNNKVIFHFAEYVITSKLACLILERNLTRADFDQVLGNHLRAVSKPSCNQQKYAINCNFRDALSKHLHACISYPCMHARNSSMPAVYGGNLSARNAGNIDKIEMMQRRAARFGYNDYSRFIHACQWCAGLRFFVTS